VEVTSLPTDLTDYWLKFHKGKRSPKYVRTCRLQSSGI